MTDQLDLGCHSALSAWVLSAECIVLRNRLDMVNTHHLAVSVSSQHEQHEQHVLSDTDRGTSTDNGMMPVLLGSPC